MPIATASRRTATAWSAGCSACAGRCASSSSARRASTTAAAATRSTLTEHGAVFRSPALSLSLLESRCRSSATTSGDVRARFALQAGRDGHLRARARRARTRRRVADRAEVAAEPSTHRRFWRGWLRAVALPRPLARDGAPLGADAEAAHLRADRRDRRRADHQPARADRRRAQLGLPLHLDPRRRLLALRAAAARASPRRPRRSWTGCRTASASAPAATTGPLQIMYGIDGRADLPRDGARPPRGLPRLARRCGSATAPRPSCSSTSTAS